MASVPQQASAQAASPDATKAISLLELLNTLVHAKGSDLHCKVGSPPRVRIDGKLMRLDTPDLTTDDTRRFLEECSDERARKDFDNDGQADFAYSVSGLGRFRVNAYKSRGSCGLAIRMVPVGALTVSDIGLPPVVESMALEPRGLLLVTGPTGSGKTTTLSALIDVINRHREAHIVTIEDPIEVLHPDNRSMINQREVRHDTSNFSDALRAAMRQDPDVIMVGEMRDEDTARAVLAAANTGHFVMSTLHTSDTVDTISRVLDFFPPHEQNQIRLALANSLRGVISQRLISKVSGGRQVAAEVCIANGHVSDAILKPELVATIRDIIAEDTYHGMQTFDQHLMDLVEHGVVDEGEALQVALNPHDLMVELRRRHPDR